MLERVRDFFRVETIEDLNRVERFLVFVIIGLLCSLYLSILFVYLFTFPF